MALLDVQDSQPPTDKQLGLHCAFKAFLSPSPLATHDQSLLFFHLLSQLCIAFLNMGLGQHVHLASETEEYTWLGGSGCLLVSHGPEEYQELLSAWRSCPSALSSGQ